MAIVVSDQPWPLLRSSLLCSRRRCFRCSTAEQPGVPVSRWIARRCSSCRPRCGVRRRRWGWLATGRGRCASLLPPLQSQFSHLIQNCTPGHQLRGKYGQKTERAVSSLMRYTESSTTEPASSNCCTADTPASSNCQVCDRVPASGQVGVPPIYRSLYTWCACMAPLDARAHAVLPTCSKLARRSWNGCCSGTLTYSH